MSFDVMVKHYQKILFLLIINFFINSNLLHATESNDVIVITADRIQNKFSKTSNDVVYIDNTEIKKSLSLSLPELLSKESDLNITNAGPRGSNSSLFLRGTDSSHTLVIIDGIIMNDPSNPNRQFDIGRLSLNNIDHIQILKGSQGLAYGSNAIGGVIVLTSKKTQDEKIHSETYADYGSFKTFSSGANFQKKIDQTSLTLGVDYLNSTGFSAADKKYNPNAENDGDHRFSLNLGSSTTFLDNFVFDLNLRYQKNIADIDKGGGPSNDDPNDRQIDEETFTKAQLTRNGIDGNSQTQFSFNHSQHNRFLEVRPDNINPQSSNTKSAGEMNTFSLNQTNYINENLIQNINLDWQVEQDLAQNQNKNLSSFLYHQLEFQNIILNAGIRIDHNQIFNNHFTYKISSGLKHEMTFYKISYSTGFRAPSLNQLFDPTYGNKNLTPETSQALELVAESTFSKTLKLSTSFFQTNIANRLSYDAITFVNRNKGEAKILGIEESINHELNSNLNYTIGATLLHARDLTLNQKLARRPDFNLKNIWAYQLNDQHSINYEMTFTGNRNDVDNSGQTISMNSYFISSLNYQYKLSHLNQSETMMYLKIKNLFDTYYEEIYGYGTGGRAFTVGCKYTY